MPDRDVKTIQDLIYYQYAKIIERRALGFAIFDLIFGERGTKEKPARVDYENRLDRATSAVGETLNQVQGDKSGA
jgi:hypothetical protein